MRSNEIEFTREDVVYSKIGAALVSVQRVELITGQILELLEEHGEVYGIMTEDLIWKGILIFGFCGSSFRADRIRAILSLLPCSLR